MRDPGDDALGVPAVVEERGEARPRLLVHPVPLVEHADPARQHRRDERRRVVGDLARLGQHRRDQEVFGPGVGRALVDVERLLADLRRGHGQGRLADPRRADQAGRKRAVAGVDDQPAGQELAEDLVLADPALFGRVGGAQVERHAADLDGLASGRACHDAPVARPLESIADGRTPVYRGRGGSASPPPAGPGAWAAPPGSGEVCRLRRPVGPGIMTFFGGPARRGAARS